MGWQLALARRLTGLRRTLLPDGGELLVQGRPGSTAAGRARTRLRGPAPVPRPGMRRSAPRRERPLDCLSPERVALYADLARRRRQAQIAARRLVTPDQYG